MALTPLFAASHSHCELIDWDKLSEGDVKEKTKDGETLLHYAAYHGYFEKIPKHLRDKKYWTETNNKTTVFMSAFERKLASWIDPNDLTEEEILKKNGNKESILTHAIFGKILKYIPQTSLTKRVLMEKVTSRENAIHAIIRTGQLNQIPLEHLTEEVLSQKDINGDSGYHILAERKIDNKFYEHLKENGINIWNHKTLTIKATDATTPLHLLACNNPEVIPKELITKEMLSLKDDKNQSVLFFWISGKKWRSIPLELITEDDLLEEDTEEGKSSLWHLANKCKNLTAWNNEPRAISDKKLMGAIIRKLSPKGLEKLKKYNIAEIDRILLKELIRKSLLEKNTKTIEI